MNKETTYRFIPITKEIADKLDKNKNYQVFAMGMEFWWSGAVIKNGHCDEFEILLPVEEKQVSKEEVTMKELRNKFFKDCTDKNEGQLPKVNTAPHDLFNWFKPYLKENIK